MDDEQLAVYYEDLRLASRDSREAATDLAHQLDKHLTACGAAGDHLHGSQTKEALDELVSATHRHLHGHLVENAHTIGQHFHLTVANYTGAENASDHDVSAVRTV
jgi:hypothetical protein